MSPRYKSVASDAVRLVSVTPWILVTGGRDASARGVDVSTVLSVDSAAMSSFVKGTKNARRRVRIAATYG